MSSACVSGKWRAVCRMVCLTVSFPVGIGSGLLPCPMVFLPAETQGEAPRVEMTSQTAEKIGVGGIFLFSATGGYDKMRGIWQRMI